MLLFAAIGALYYRSFVVKTLPIAWIWLPVPLRVSYRFGRRAAATTVLGLGGVLRVESGERGGAPRHVLPGAGVYRFARVPDPAGPRRELRILSRTVGSADSAAPGTRHATS